MIVRTTSRFKVVAHLFSLSLELQLAFARYCLRELVLRESLSPIPKHYVKRQHQKVFNKYQLPHSNRTYEGLADLVLKEVSS